jgi:hypothetical protein
MILLRVVAYGMAFDPFKTGVLNLWSTRIQGVRELG